MTLSTGKKFRCVSMVVEVLQKLAGYWELLEWLLIVVAASLHGVGNCGSGSDTGTLSCSGACSTGRLVVWVMAESFDAMTLGLDFQMIATSWTLHLTLIFLVSFLKRDDSVWAVVHFWWHTVAATAGWPSAGVLCWSPVAADVWGLVDCVTSVLSKSTICFVVLLVVQDTDCFHLSSLPVVKTTQNLFIYL